MVSPNAEGVEEDGLSNLMASDQVEHAINAIPGLPCAMPYGYGQIELPCTPKWFFGEDETTVSPYNVISEANLNGKNARPSILTRLSVKPI